MTDINYKESQWDLFVEESFGKHTYATLLLFNHNAHNIKKMIEFYWNLLTSDKTLNNNENSSKKESVNLKHMVLLDSIAKIQSLIETLLVLIDSLEEDYSHLANNVAFYNS